MIQTRQFQIPFKAVLLKQHSSHSYSLRKPTALMKNWLCIDLSHDISTLHNIQPCLNGHWLESSTKFMEH